MRERCQPETREGKAGPVGKSERPIVPRKPAKADGGKGPRFRRTREAVESQEIGVSLTTPETVRKLQEALHAKAKAEPGYRYYCLYDKMYRRDVLTHAYRCARLNGGAAGVDGQTYDDIEAYGVERWRGELAHEAYRAVAHARKRLRQWLCKKHRQRGLGFYRDPDACLHGTLGLARLTGRTHDLPCAKA